ncbi:MAG: hypothetical protein SGBAC_007349 [Bacillariaceae sp.]
MRNILDKVHRELSVTKTLMEEKELRRLQEGENQNEPQPSGALIHSLRGGHDSDQDSNSNIVASSNLNEHQGRRRLRGGSKNEQPRQMLTEDDDSPLEEGPSLAFNRGSAMFAPFSDLDQTFSILDDNATISDNATAMDSTDGIIANSNTTDHQLDVGAWLLMVLVVGSAVFGLVTYRSSPRRSRRRGSNNNNGGYQYKGVMLPTLDEDDWGN